MRNLGGAQSHSETAPEGLLTLDRLEQGLEIPLAEAARAVALDHLEEERRAILSRLGEDLEEVAVLVAVGEDPQPPQVVPVLADLADAIGDVFVIGVGRREEDDSLVLQHLDGANDVLRLQRDMLDAWAAEVLEIFLDLALPLALGRLVDRELDLSLPVGHHLGHQGRVLGGDVLVREVQHLGHAEGALVELDPVLHPAELDVADAVVDRAEADAVPLGRVDRLVARQVEPGVVGAVHERVHRVAVGGDRRQLDPAELVLDPAGLDDAARAALHGLPVRLGRVRDGERDVLDAVAVAAGVVRDLVLLSQRAGDDETDVALLEHVRGAVADARLRAGVSHAREAQRVLVVEGSLLRVADVELDVIPALDRHESGAHGADATPPSPSSSASGDSSKLRRSGTSFTPTITINSASAQTAAAVRKAGCRALASCARARGGRRWRAAPCWAPAGSPWFTITPITVTPSVEPIERENCVSAVAIPIARIGTEFCTLSTKTCIISPIPIPATTMFLAAWPLVVSTPIRQRSSIPAPRT